MFSGLSPLHANGVTSPSLELKSDEELFLLACKTGDLKTVDSILKRVPELAFNAKTSENDSGLILACENDHFKIIETLCTQTLHNHFPGKMGLNPLEILTAHLSKWRTKNREYINDCILSISLLFQNGAYLHTDRIYGAVLLELLFELFENDIIDLSILEAFFSYGFPQISFQKPSTEKLKLFLLTLEVHNGYNLFLEACRRNDLDKCRELMCKIPPYFFELPDQKGDTALHIAFQHGHLSIAFVLIVYISDPHRKGSLGFTVLELLSGNLHRLSLALPLKPVGSVQQLDAPQITNLEKEIKIYTPCILRLISMGADPNTLNDEDSYLLHVLIDLYNNRLIKAKFFTTVFSLATFRFDLVDKNGLLPLQKLILCHYSKLKDIVEIFIRKKAPIFTPNIFSSTNSLQHTSMVLNSYKIYMRMIALHEINNANRILYEEGILPQDVQLFLLEHIKMFSSHFSTKHELKKLLPKKGKYLNLIKLTDYCINNDKHETKIKKLYAYAVEIGCKDLLKFLHTSGADVIDATYEGHTPLTRACRHKNFDIAAELVELGADVNAMPRGKKFTALQLLMELLEKQLNKKTSFKKIQSIINTIHLFLLSGANPNVATQNNAGLIRLLNRTYLANNQYYEQIKRTVLIKPDHIDKNPKQTESLIETILDINEEPKSNCAISAVLLATEKFFIYEDLCDKQSPSERERIVKLINSFDEMRKEFSANQTEERAYQLVIKAKELKVEFDKINGRKRKQEDLFDKLYHSKIFGVDTISYDFSCVETLILTFYEQKYLILLKEMFSSIKLATNVFGNSLHVSGIDAITMSASRINNFCKKYYKSAKELSEKKEAAPITSETNKKLNEQTDNTATAPETNSVSNVKSTASSTTSNVQSSSTNSLTQAPKKARSPERKLTKKDAEQAKVEGRLNAKRLQREQAKSKKSEKRKAEKKPANELKKESIQSLTVQKSFRASPRAAFPITVQKMQPVPSRPVEPLPITGNVGFTILSKKIDEPAVKEIIFKKKKIALGELQREYLEIALKHLSECKSLAFRLKRDKFQFIDSLESKIYAKFFEFHLLKGIKSLLDGGEEVASVLKKHNVDCCVLSETHEWLRLNFPAIDGAAFEKLALKFASSRITDILRRILAGKGIKKYDEQLDLESFKFSNRDFEKKVVEKGDKQLLSNISKEIEFLEEIFKSSNQPSEYLTSAKKSLWDLSYFSAKLTAACENFKHTEEMQKLITWGKLSEDSPQDIDIEEVRLFFQRKAKPLTTLRTNLGIIRFEIGTRGKIWWL